MCSLRLWKLSSSLRVPGRGGKQQGRLTSEVGLVPLLEDIIRNLLVVGTLVEVPIETAKGVLLDDATHQLAWLA